MVITWQQLRDAREYADLTQAELATKLGVSARTIVNWESENGGGVPRKSEYKVDRELGAAMRNLEAFASIPPPSEWEPEYRIPDGEGGEVVVDGAEYDAWQQNQEPDLQRDGIADVTSNARRRRQEAMADFTDADILAELVDRTRKRGVAESDWSARRFRADVAPDLHTMHIDELSLAADEKNEHPDEDLRQP